MQRGGGAAVFHSSGVRGGSLAPFLFGMVAIAYNMGTTTHKQ
jgi:hypothetical protein